MDNVQQGQISGEVDWEPITLIIPAGTHIIRWSYSKDGSVNAGSDAGWIDQVTLEE